MKKLLNLWFGKKNLDDSKEISQLYDLYKFSFISFALKYYPIEEETAEDIYQESFMIMYQNIREGKFRDRQASLKTYLFEIGKHRICNYLNKNKLEFIPLQTLSSEWVDQNYDMEEWTEAQKIVNMMINEADDICNQILRLYYWERLRMEEIARRLNYKSEQVAKNKKNSCLRRFTFELKRRLEKAEIRWKDKKEKNG